MKPQITQSQAWAVIAESAGWNGKELPAYDIETDAGWEWSSEAIETYGAACAAHAREMALSEAIDAIESANARRVLYVPDCIDVIEALKGK